MQQRKTAANLSRIILTLPLIIASQSAFAAWKPRVPSGAEVIMEFSNQTEPMRLKRGKEESSAGGVLGSFKTDELRKNQVLFRSWPVQIRINGDGQFIVEDLKNDAEIVHPRIVRAGVRHKFQAACDPRGWQVTIDGKKTSIAAKNAPTCVAESWGDVTVAALNRSGKSPLKGTLDLAYYLEGYEPSGSESHGEKDQGKGEDTKAPTSRDRVTFLKVKKLKSAKSYARKNWKAPKGTGGIELTYTPAELGDHVVLLDAHPLKVEFTRRNQVIVSWTDGKTKERLALGTKARPGRAVNIHWRCSAGKWLLDVDGKSAREKTPKGVCVGDTRGERVFAGSANNGRNQMDGLLRLHWYADRKSGSDNTGGGSGSASGGQDRPKPEGVAFVGDFETGDIHQFPNLGYKKDLNYAMNARPRGRNGKFAGRFEVRYGDRGYDNKGKVRKVRSEAFDSSQTMGDTWWYGWSSKIDPAWQDDGLKAFYVIQQFHQNEGSPPIGQRYVNGEWIIYCNVCGNKQVNLWKGRVAKNKWVDWVVQAKWSYEDDGFFRVWKDGKQVVDYRGKTANKSRRSPYFKFGIYRNPQDTQTQVIWHDEYRRGYSRNAVDPSKY